MQIDIHLTLPDLAKKGWDNFQVHGNTHTYHPRFGIVVHLWDVEKLKGIRACSICYCGYRMNGYTCECS